MSNVYLALRVMLLVEIVTHVATQVATAMNAEVYLRIVTLMVAVYAR